MTCAETKVELMAWQLGELHGEARDALERHVAECTTCVREFIELKRAVELAEGGPMPSNEARLALRTAVQELTLGAPWWERPVAFFVASASVALALAQVLPR